MQEQNPGGITDGGARGELTAAPGRRCHDRRTCLSGDRCGIIGRSAVADCNRDRQFTLQCRQRVRERRACIQHRNDDIERRFY
jgi:hypothetical protein